MLGQVNDTPTNPEMDYWTYNNVVPNISFDVSWDNDVLVPWRGIIHETGSTLGTNAFRGTTRLDFTSLNHRELAIGTYFNLSDLDGGSGQEVMILRAYDSNNDLIEGAWLNEVLGISDTGTGAGPSIWDTPRWSLNGGVYTFTGNENSFWYNPNQFITLSNNQTLSYLEIQRIGITDNSFSLGAPVPTPGSLAFLSIGGIVATRRRRG